ncbi:UDP-N-acetylmuramate--L-alanine ligase [Candidatus Cardinium hertigii]|uniref:UDP-N-acetylmuramate--L-alanine ligase n=1 Tax=Candidatus Cardinium hertigii TaxID=247481 RepID=A0A2Z3L8Q0_9BACT|nr:Mur ligase family protein [Candidatus Cardinium hertigii]AWN81791.1 UDP-N-acetylmuramate--L-alanine ligase [Candidatus Cardinium hertigii]
MLSFPAYCFIYFLGIGGIGMSALARLLAAQGYTIVGYDKAASPLVTQLQNAGMFIHFTDSVTAIPSVIRQHPTKTLIIYTPAIPSDSPILNYLRGSGYTMLSRAEALGSIVNHLPTVAIAGTHGKTTASAILAHMLYESTLAMLAFVGGIMHRYNSNIIYNHTLNQVQVVITEADEFNKSFLQLTPSHSIVTSIDPDHLDTYATVATLQENFKQFIKQSKQTVLVHAKAANQLQLTTHGYSPLLTYGLNNAVIQADNIRIAARQSVFDYIGDGVTIKEIILPLPGSYNIENALAAITMGLTLGLTEAHVRASIASFPGMQRRFDYIARNEKFVLIDDYAHHPAEIAALLSTVRHIYPNGCITAIFQPHLFSRTADFYEAFGTTLSIADQVLLLPIYPAREVAVPAISSQLIYDCLSCKTKILVEDGKLLTILPSYMRQHAYHVVVTIGAGDIGTMVPAIAAVLAQQLLQ